MNNEFFILVDNKKINISIGHSLAEWRREYGNTDLWDFLIEDLVNGAIEPNEELVYWLIDGRLYETRIYMLPL